MKQEVVRMHRNIMKANKNSLQMQEKWSLNWLRGKDQIYKIIKYFI